MLLLQAEQRSVPNSLLVKLLLRDVSLRNERRQAVRIDDAVPRRREGHEIDVACVCNRAVLKPEASSSLPGVNT